MWVKKRIVIKFNDLIRGKGTFNKIIKSIILLKEIDATISIGINVTKKNISDLEENLLDLLEKINYNKLNIQLSLGIDKEGFANLLTNDFFEIKKEHRERFKNIINNLDKNGYYKKNGFKRNELLRNCGIGISITINSNGDIYPCDKLHIKNGNILSANMKKIIKQFNQLNKDTEINNMPFCSKCDLKNICVGKCRIENYKYSGSYLIPECSEDYKQSIYERLVYDY